jgi:UDP-2,4-diacetamido-2,4,6-trideoxy-beta-L-altropyranose hydrolase
MRKVLICADASGEIGTGHIRRMLTLATELVGTVEVEMCTSVLGAQIVAQSGISASLRTGPCTPDAVQALVNGQDYAAVVLDNYHWQAGNEAPLRQIVPCLMVVDDLADRPHDADILLDQNAHHSDADYDGLVPSECLKLVGGMYCLLAKQFRDAKPPAAQAQDAPIFVSLGGGDPKNDLPRLVGGLLSHTNLPLTIATGRHIAGASDLAALAKQNPKRVELIFDSPDVAKQMSRSQIAVASAGTMTWERAAVQLPSICLIVADNQADSANWLAMKDVHEVFDIRSDWSEVSLARAAAALAQDPARKAAFRQASSQILSADGVVRVKTELLKKIQQPSR